MDPSKPAPAPLVTSATAIAESPSRTPSTSSNPGSARSARDIVARAESLLRSIQAQFDDENNSSSSGSEDEMIKPAQATSSRPTSVLFPTSPAFVPFSLPAPNPAPVQDTIPYQDRYGPLEPSDVAFLQQISQTVSAAPRPALDGLWEAASPATTKVTLKRPERAILVQAVESTSTSAAPTSTSSDPPALSSPPPNQPPLGLKIIAPTPSKVPLPISPAVGRVKRTFAGEDESDEEERPAPTVPSNWSSRSFEPLDVNGSSESDSGKTPTANSPLLSRATLLAKPSGTSTDVAAMEASVEQPQRAEPSLSRKNSLGGMPLAEIPPFRPAPTPFVFGAPIAVSAPRQESYKRKPDSPSRHKPSAPSKPVLTAPVTVFDKSPKIPSRSHTASVPPPSQKPTVPAGAVVYASPTPTWVPQVSHNNFPRGSIAPPPEWSPAIADSFLQHLYTQQQFAAQGAPGMSGPYYARPGPNNGGSPPPGPNSPYPSLPFQPYPPLQLIYGAPPPGPPGSFAFAAPYNSQQPARPTTQQTGATPSTSPSAPPPMSLHPSPIIRSKESEHLVIESERLRRQISELTTENARLKKQTSDQQETVVALEKGVDRLKLKVEKTTEFEEANEKLRSGLDQEIEKTKSLEKRIQAVKEGATATRVASQAHAKQLQSENNSLRAEATSYKAKFEDASTGTSNLVAELIQAEEKIRAYEEQLVTENNQRDDGIVAIRRLNVRVADLQLELATSKANEAKAASAAVGDTLSRAAAFRVASKNSISDEDLKNLQTQAAALREKVGEGEKALAKAQTANGDLQRRLSASTVKGTQELESAQALVRQLTRKVEELRSELETKKKEHESHVVKLEEMAATEAIFEDLVSNCEMMETRNVALQAELTKAHSMLAEGRGGQA